ncbi:MAG: DNA polymerase IV [Burkholderiaceae bacterium]|nr:DNA polymerase IV [Burkholderiaceae bacterium]
MPSSRRIAHLDMDAFFASVELLSYPELKGHAVVVGGRSTEAPSINAQGERTYARLRDYVGRGVITTSTYEARALGVFSGMGLMKSAVLAPEAILLPANFEAYRHYSRLFKATVASIAPLIEDRGIDEIYIDLSDIDEETESLAKRIKNAVSQATGLSCSIGVSPNKLLSKICSDLDKPNGITILASTELATRIWPLAAKKINGIGPKANEKLDKLGIHTIGELALAAPEMLIEHFGRSTGQWLHQAAHGIDDRPVVTTSEPKSLSRETTFERDLHVKQDRTRLSEVFTELCHRLAEDLARKGYAAKTIGIKVKYADFQVVTRDLTVPDALHHGTSIRNAATECLRRIPLDQRIRLLGVRAGSLLPISSLNQAPVGHQPDLPFE